jgi:hypothetical protein
MILETTFEKFLMMKSLRRVWFGFEIEKNEQPRFRIKFSICDFDELTLMIPLLVLPKKVLLITHI